MWSAITRLLNALALITMLSFAGYVVVRLAFMAVCWIGGHDIFEAMVGLIAPVAFGIAIGIEGYLWLRDIRSHPIDFDTTR